MREKLVLITRHSLSVLSHCRPRVREGISLIYSLLSAINADNVDRLISRPARRGPASLGLKNGRFYLALCLSRVPAASDDLFARPARSLPFRSIRRVQDRDLSVARLRAAARSIPRSNPGAAPSADSQTTCETYQILSRSFI